MVTFRRSTVQDLSEARFRYTQWFPMSLKSFVIFKTFASFSETDKTSSQIVTAGCEICEVVLRNVILYRQWNVACCAVNCSCGVSWNQSWASACVSIPDSSVLSESSRALRSFCRWSLQVVFWKAYSLPQKKKGIELVCIRFMKIVRNVCSLVSTTSSHY